MCFDWVCTMMGVGGWRETAAVRPVVLWGTLMAQIKMKLVPSGDSSPLDVLGLENAADIPRLENALG